EVNMTVRRDASFALDDEAVIVVQDPSLRCRERAGTACDVYRARLHDGGGEAADLRADDRGLGRRAADVGAGDDGGLSRVERLRPGRAPRGYEPHRHTGR